MMEIIDTGLADVIGVRIDGKIVGADMDRLTKEVERMVETHEKLKVYAEIVSLGGMTLAALVKDLRLGVRNLKRFERKAVVSDKAWIGKVAAVADKLFPSVDVKHFEPEQKDEALRWVRN